jgi:glycosyltransferase involved in cell wall biosynthesis
MSEPGGDVRDVSVVIPTLNAAGTLPATLSCLTGIGDIVVVDGGGTDATRCIAADGGARVLSAPRGRGGQLAAGIAAARHPWPGWRRAVAAHMADPGRAAYFRFALDSAHWRAVLLTRAVALRGRLFALPYGDQGLLIHRDLLQAVGGMRALPLMEDVDLVRRLGRRRLVGLDVVAVTGAARWERDGWTRRSARNLVCLSLYFAGVKPATIARLYQ